MSDSTLNPGGLKLLMADDSEVIQVTLQRCFKSLGYPQVDEAADGVQAMRMIHAALAKNQPYHILFCDWNMPEKDGWQVLTECRQDPRLNKLAFVMVTSESEQHKMLDALQAGANDYIIKPISSENLKKKLERLLATFGPTAA
jgi:two-component system chemotaxis response regulator CheY